MKLGCLNCESTNRLTSVAIYSVGQQLGVLQAGAWQLAPGRRAADEEEAAWRGPGHVVTATLARVHVISTQFQVETLCLNFSLYNCL